MSILAHLKAKYILQSCNSVGCIDSEKLVIEGSLGASVTMPPFITPAPGVVTTKGPTNIVATLTSLTEISLYNGINGFFNFLGIANKRIFGSDRTAIGSFPDGDSFRVTMLSENGDILIASAIGDDNDATGAPTLPDSGVVYVFGRNGNDWLEEAYIKEIVPKSFAFFGLSARISSDGSTLTYVATGCNDYEAINGLPAPVNPSVIESPAIYIYVRDVSNSWNLQACIKGSFSDELDSFGNFILSEDGRMLIVGAEGEDSSETGVQQIPLVANNNAENSGAVYVFVSDGNIWTQQAYIKSSNTESGDGFGRTISLNKNGTVLAISALGEDSEDRNNQTDNTRQDAGAVYVFERNGPTWNQTDYIKPENIDAIGSFGSGLSFNDAGDFLAIGDPNENSDSAGVGGDASNKNHDSGAVYLFKKNGNTWSQQIRIKANEPVSGEKFSLGSLSDSVDGLILTAIIPGKPSGEGQFLY